MSTRTTLTLAALAVLSCTGCKTIYSNVFTNKKNSFKPPVVKASADLKPAQNLDILSQPIAPIPGGDQNTIPGLNNGAAPVPGLEAAPAAPAGGTPAIPGL